MLILDTNNFQKEVLESNIPVMVDFFGVWCPPCQVLGPIIEELANEFQDKIKIFKLDVDKYSEIAQEYNIMSVPTLIFFKNGKEINRLVGLYSKEEIKKEIEMMF